MTDDIVTRLQQLLDGPVPMTVTREDVRDVLAEIDRLRAVVDAIDAIHQSFTDSDTGMTFCDECNTIDLWPCRTHTLLQPEEAHRG